MSNTHFESEGYGTVRIQHCEHKDANSVVCDEYLGVEYPSKFCEKHQPSK